MSERRGVEEIRSKEDFARFLTDLARSRVEEPHLWENDSVEALLEAWAAWVEDMDGYFENLGQSAPTEPSWGLVAQMLLAAGSMSR